MLTQETEKQINNGAMEDDKQFFITEENFQRLRQLQQEIFLVTEISPSIRKLVNLLLTEENLKELKMKLIEQYRLLSM